MGLSGTRGLVRISKVPGRDLQAAMVAEQVDERDFYQSVTGSAFEGEYGERTSARRRGNKFESNLHMNNAAGLRRALGPLVGADPEEMTVRDFGEEVPGPPGVLHAIRLKRMREILDDTGRRSRGARPGHPSAVAWWVGPGTSVRDHEYVTPDFLVLDRPLGMYLPGEEKSFIVRDGVADGADLFLTRRQAGAQILALRSEAARVGLADRVANEARFIFATPFGLRLLLR